MILHNSTACDCGIGTLVPTLIPETQGKQQKCSNSLIGKSGVTLSFHLLDTGGMPGLGQGNAEVEGFLSSLIIHVFFM